MTLTGGTWAALRDTPVWDEEAQAWDYSPALVLHEAGDAITAIRPDGSTQTCTRAMFEQEVLRELVKRGHALGTNVGDFGGYQAIRWDPVQRVYYGASESRKDGCAIGY